MKFVILLLSMLGIMCLIFPLHIAPTGVCLLLLAFLLYWAQKAKSKKRKRLFLALAAAGIVIGGALSGYILYAGQDCYDETDPPQTVIVLGAQIYGNQPSRTLKERLDRTLFYAEENPDCVIFVTGGQGEDEIKTEASVMAAYLEKNGIDKRRIYLEETSATTRQNLLNVLEIAEKEHIPCENALIVTSDFHLCRALYIARSVGIDAGGIVSTTYPAILRLNYALREVFSFVKAFWQAR